MNIGKESESVEFKESLAQLDKGLKSLTAMLNKNNRGTVYFGVDNDGNVVGTSVGRDTETKIRGRIKETVAPGLFFRINVLEDGDGKNYIALEGEGTDIPYSFDGRYYIRNSSSDDSVDNVLLRRMLISQSVDILKEKPSYRNDLTFFGLLRYLENVGVHAYDSSDFYQSLRLYSSDGKYNMTAFLLSDQNSFSVKLVTFGGNDKANFVSRREFGGKGLLDIADDIIAYFKVYNDIKIDVSEGQRKETPLFDFESFREALANALVHNAWAEELSPSIFIYDESMEILSYGKIPYSLPLEEFYRGKSLPVNRALFQVFLLSRLSEQTGHGVKIITSRYGKKAYSIGENTVSVNIPFGYLRDEVLARRLLQSSGSGNEQKIMSLLKERPGITAKKISEETGLSESGTKKILERMVSKGLVKREGNRRNGSWVAVF